MNLTFLLSQLRLSRTKHGRRARGITIALLIYTIVGFFIVPALVKSQLLKRLPALTHRQAAVQQMKMNPYALSLTIRGLSLTETNGEPFAGFDEFYANFELSSLFRWAWTFSEIRLTHPTANIVRDARGQFNFANLIAGEATPPPTPANQSKSLPIVLLQHLLVTNANLHFTDHTRAAPLRLDYGPVDLDVRGFTTRRNRDGNYSLAVTTGAGGNIDWVGTVSANPPQSAGKFTLRGVVLKRYSPYLADFARAEIADGILDVSSEYRLNADASPLELDVTNTAVRLANFRLQAPETGETLIALDHVAVTHACASLAGRQARAPFVEVRGGSVLARRESDGQLNWLKLLGTPTNVVTSASAATNPPATPWKVALDDFNLEGFAVAVEDRVPADPAGLGLEDLRVHVKGVSNQSNAPVTALVSFNWRGGGMVLVDAHGTLLPPAGEANVAVTSLSLPPIQPYVEQQARLVLGGGNLNVNGQARYEPGQANAPAVQFTGDVSVAKFASVDTIAFHDFAKWDELNVRGLRFAMQTNALSMAEVKFTGLETSLVVSSNGQLAVQELLKSPAVSKDAKGTAVSSTPPPAPEAFPIQIDALVFEKCSLRATDQSLTPHFNTSIEEFSGSIRNLTLPGFTKAGVDIHGKVSALAPFEVTGSITPDARNPFVDLKLSMKNDDLTPFTPYTEKFAGHPLNKGKLSFDLDYKIENRKLAAENVIAIDQFTFGPRNDNTNATKLPVKLAVALLKDRNGRIDLNLPVSGSLDDPKFSIAGVVWKAVLNILVKAATSPFSLLGAMFGGGEELQYVDFVPGAVTLDAAQTNKLNTLAKALYERPVLNLEVRASFDAADRQQVTRQKLLDRMKSLRLAELTARGKPVPTVSEFQLDPAGYERLLRQTYRDTFKTTPERRLREAREAAAATNQLAASSATFSSARPPAEVAKGAAQLMQKPPANPAASSSQANRSGPPADSHVSATPKTEEELVLDEMEQRLMAAAPATGDDLRELLQQRCLSVQKYLVETGKIVAERVFVVTPNAVDSQPKGLPRVTFSLD